MVLAGTTDIYVEFSWVVEFGDTFLVILWTAIQYYAVYYEFSDSGNVVKCQYDEKCNVPDFQFYKIFFNHHTFHKHAVFYFSITKLCCMNV
jgi:hypothetical protein